MSFANLNSCLVIVLGLLISLSPGSANAACDGIANLEGTWIGAAKNLPLDKDYDPGRPMTQQSWTIRKAKAPTGVEFDVEEFVSTTSRAQKSNKATFYAADFNPLECIMRLKYLASMPSETTDASKRHAEGERYFKILDISEDGTGGNRIFIMNVLLCANEECSTGERAEYLGL
jgi:hypothetical protein